jgi:magnesium-transporting ATPase (P-type)
MVTRAPGDTLLARIIQLVKEAQANRPAAQLFIERFERGYAKVVVLGAILLGTVPMALGWWTAREAIYRAMIFLVVASPCALAAAMMPTLLSALSNAARNGILFKGSAFVEALGKIDAIAFDKTGTLTSGHPIVTEVVSTSDSRPVVRNSIILVDFIDLRRSQGMELREAVVDAGAVRFRPMVLTAAAVVVSAAVILFDPIFQGLAISLMAGELASLVLSRMIVPVVYYLAHARSQRAPASDEVPLSEAAWTSLL